MMSCSSQTKCCGLVDFAFVLESLATLFKGTSCGKLSGTLTRAKCSTPCGSRIRTARLRLRLEICGKGRPGSNASGVSVGKTVSEKYRFAPALWVGVSCEYSGT